MDRPGEVWAALRGHPLRFLVSSWPWRSLAYLATGSLVGLLALVALFVLLGVGLLTAPLVVGLLVLGGLPLLGLTVGAVERRRLRWVQPGLPAVPRAYPAPDGAGLLARLRAARRAPASARDLGWTVLLALALWVVDAAVAFNAVLFPVVFLASPALAGADRVSLLWWSVDSPQEAVPLALVGGPVTLVLAAYAVGLVAAAQASLARILLSPSEERLAQRVRELDRSRAGLVDAFEVERRRIERDLHDGVQQRLVALTMTLGLAELDARDEATLQLLRRAHGEAEQALEELRSTVRGIHPRVLVDHGLAAAVHEVADRSPVPVQVELGRPGRLPGRLPAAVEAAAYFVVSEALTNVARHSGARSARVVGWEAAGQVVVVVSDDGDGGAAVTPGGGLAGLVSRLEALDGSLTVSSPAGGPTEVRMACPAPAPRPQAAAR